MSFSTRMTALARALDHDPADALARAETLEVELLDAATTDPQELGWARDYRIRALHRLGRHREGLLLILAPPPRPMSWSARNAAWIHSVGAEMAVRSGVPERARGLIGKALELRVSAEDEEGARMAVETGVALLLEAGLRSEADVWLDEVESRAYAAPAGSSAAMIQVNALAAVAAAPWFPGSLAAAERRRAAIELHEAAGAGDQAAVARAIAAGVDVNARHPGRPGMPTPLHAAAFAGHVEAVTALLAFGAAIDARNIQGRTALHMAADQDHARVTEILCDAGAALDLQDFVGQTALHLASWQGYLGCVLTLCAAGADLERRDVNGDTPLAIAATEPVPEVVGGLLEAGADPEAVNDHGQTPLLRAAMDGQAEVVELLLDVGVDRKRRDRHGRSAMAWAKAEGHQGVIAALRAR
ncbi:MAG: ankyrin repeat domain-containing protein [Nannocystaceae bacterium]